MGKISKLVMASIVAAAFATGSAMAFGQPGVRGFSIGLIGSTNTFDTSGSEEEGRAYQDSQANATEITTASISTDADFGSGFIEYTAHNEGSLAAFTFGLEFIPGKHSIGAKSRTDSNNAKDTNDDGTYTAKANVSHYASLYFEPTIMAGEYFGAYLKGGISHLKVSSLEDIAIGATSSTYGDAHVLGGMYGVGIKFGNILFFKLEATRTEYSSLTLTSLTGNQNIITAKPEQDSLRLAIGINF